MHELLTYTTNESFLDDFEDTLDFYKDNKRALQMLLHRFLGKKLSVGLLVSDKIKSYTKC